MIKHCKDCKKEFKVTGKNHIRCTDCKVIEEKRKAREYDRKASLKNNYGITVEDYNKMFEDQQGCCAICGSHQTNFKKVFAVDHSHTTDKVRGLLCMNCNLLLGYAKDDIEILLKAIAYLKNTQNNL